MQIEAGMETQETANQSKKLNAGRIQRVRQIEAFLITFVMVFILENQNGYQVQIQGTAGARVIEFPQLDLWHQVPEKDGRGMDYNNI